MSAPNNEWRRRPAAPLQTIPDRALTGQMPPDQMLPDQMLPDQTCIELTCTEQRTDQTTRRRANRPGPTPRRTT